MENIEFFLNDLKKDLSDITSTLKEMDTRLKTIELDISKNKIFNSFLECNYNTFLEIIEKHKREKDTKKEVANNFLKNIFWSAFIVICNLILVAVVTLILKLK